MKSPEDKQLINATRKYYQSLIKTQNFIEIEKSLSEIDSMSESIYVMTTAMRTLYCIKYNLPKYNFYLARFKQSVTYRGGNTKSLFSGLSNDHIDNFTISVMHRGYKYSTKYR